MARPQKTGLDYFPHDTDAVNDEKIEAMRAEYGNDGYAFFFICCERIFRAENGEINLSNTAMKKALISKIGIDANLFDHMLSTAFDIDLFSKADFDSRNVLTSNGIKSRYEAISKLRERWRKNKQIIREENPAENDTENPEETPESKGKKSKGKNYSLEIKNFRQRYGEFINLVDEYVDILKMTRVSGKVADSVLYGVYEQMEKHPVIVVKYALYTVVHNPSLHSKKENYFFGIMRNTTADEATEKLSKIRDSHIKSIPERREIVVEEVERI